MRKARDVVDDKQAHRRYALSMLQTRWSPTARAAAADIEGYEVCGKTSTAEIASEEGGYKKEVYNIGFCGFIDNSSSNLVCFVGANEVYADARDHADLQRYNGECCQAVQHYFDAVELEERYRYDQDLLRALRKGWIALSSATGTRRWQGIALPQRPRFNPNDAFFCIVGTVVDGHSFAQDAIDRGATVARGRAQGVPGRRHRCHRGRRHRLRARPWPTPRRTTTTTPPEAFALVGITGTNGKTTTTYLVEHIAQRGRQRAAGVIGTVGNKHRRRHAETRRAHHAGIARPAAAVRPHARRRAATVVAMEVSSHALDLRPHLGHRHSP